jgi:hypothetical protein
VGFRCGWLTERGVAAPLSTTPRAAARDLAVWTATVYWCGLAYVTVAATFMPLTYPNATWGAPDPGPILTGLFVAIIPLVGDGSGERKWAWWAWVDQPAGDSLSWTLASVLCVLGLGLVCLRGAADTLREAE